MLAATLRPQGLALNTIVPNKQQRDFKVGETVRVNLHHGKIEDAVVRAVPQDADGIKLQVDVVGLASRR